MKIEIDWTPDELDTVRWAVEDANERDTHNLARHERTLVRKEALRKLTTATGRKDQR